MTAVDWRRADNGGCKWDRTTQMLCKESCNRCGLEDSSMERPRQRTAHSTWPVLAAKTYEKQQAVMHDPSFGNMHDKVCPARPDDP